MKATGQLIFSRPSSTQVDDTKVAQEESIKQLTAVTVQHDALREKFDDLVKTPDTALISISTTFPFEFFPKKIIVDKSKVSIIDNLFYKSKHVESIPIQELADITIDTDIFFASLKIIEKAFKDEPIIIKYLKKKEAFRVRRIVEGLIVARDEGVDLAKLDINDLSTKLEEIGRTAENETSIA